MKFLEKDLEQIIFETDLEELHDRGLYIYGKRYKQLRIGNYGIADIVTVDRTCNHKEVGGQSLTITIFELKKDKIGISAFLQALGYLKGIKTYLEHRDFDFHVYYKIVLIGRNLDTHSTYCYLEDFIPTDENYANGSFLTNLTYEYTLNGLVFNNCPNYNLNKKGF